jgi:glycosyltransferase involved in cell wall biosynthesis
VIQENYPLVSILINNYNYGNFLAEAIDSALNQTYPYIEVIVVDDGSTDNSHDVIQSYGDKIVSVFKENGGQASAFNIGFDKSQGEIICFLDADDLFLRDKIEKIVNIFKNYLHSDWCFHPLQFVNSSLEKEQQEIYTGKSGLYDIRPYIRRGKLSSKLPFHGIATSGMCFQRSLLAKMLPMPETIRITSDDYLKYSAFGLSEGFILLEELAFQRIHDNNAYTLRKDKQDLRAKIQIITAYWLRKNIPSISKFANNIFALGLGMYKKLGITNKEVQLIINAYFSSLKLLEKLEINLRAIYYSLNQ